MKREQVPPGMHIAIPTKDSDTLHEGPYSHRCETCCALAAAIASRNLPVVDGFAIGVGSVVRLKPEHQMSGDPEWVTITESRVNIHTGEIWLGAFALGHNRVLTAGDFAEVAL